MLYIQLYHELAKNENISQYAEKTLNEKAENRGLVYIKTKELNTRIKQ